MVDKITKPLRTVMGGTNDVSKALKNAKDQLKQLNDAQSRVDAWRKTDKNLAIVRNSIKGTEARIKDLKAEIAKVPAPTKDMARALKQAQEEARQLKSRSATLQEKQHRLRQEFQAAGIDTAKLASHQRDLTTRIDQTRAAVDRETAAMKRQNEVAHKLYAAKADYDKLMDRHGTMMHAGQMTLGVGLAGAAPVALAIKQYASLEDAMLGVAKQVGDARDGAGNLTRTYYELREQIMALSERIPMAAQEIAAIVEAGARMGIQGKRDLMAYAETAAIAATAFGLPVDQVGDDMAKIAQL
ncbi:phage tail tape measure protein, partial [Immundisolibacter sp.]|uniref:phage tail tape measure protein n=1 Tax=Immundisolibacter sp. TaxID=1934948 RepID=UPI002635F6A0